MSNLMERIVRLRLLTSFFGTLVFFSGQTQMAHQEPGAIYIDSTTLNLRIAKSVSNDRTIGLTTRGELILFNNIEKILHTSARRFGSDISISSSSGLSVAVFDPLQQSIVYLDRFLSEVRTFQLHSFLPTLSQLVLAGSDRRAYGISSLENELILVDLIDQTIIDKTIYNGSLTIDINGDLLMISSSTNTQIRSISSSEVLLSTDKLYQDVLLNRNSLVLANRDKIEFYHFPSNKHSTFMRPESCGKIILFRYSTNQLKLFTNKLGFTLSLTDRQ